MKYTIKESNIHGSGLFASADLSENEAILQLEGNAVKFNELTDDGKLYSLPSHPENKRSIFQNVFFLGWDQWLVCNNDGSFINHSCNHNCILENQTLKTIRPVKKDEELTIFYYSLSSNLYMEYEQNEDLYSWNNKLNFSCNCKSQYCLCELMTLYTKGWCGPKTLFPSKEAIYTNRSAVELLQHPSYGRKVIANKTIKKGSVFLSNPVMVFLAEQWHHAEQTALFHYCFRWGEHSENGALVMGEGSFINHSYHPNATYIKHTHAQKIDFIALKDIQKGEEIFINYNGDAEAPFPVWFEIRGSGQEHVNG